MDLLSDKIKQHALQLGFQKVGIAKAERLTEDAQHLEEWLARGYNGTMSWMAKNVDKRNDPRLVLPDAKSVIVVAMNYYTDVQHQDDEEIGKISRYAWGDDYHNVLTGRLEMLLKFIQSNVPSAQGKVYVDTGPVMEKVWAERAGIGWEGKHTNLITQEYGSWVFLGVIILDRTLDYDLPGTDHCGSCTLCIDACPTDAITEPYVLDSNRCISYLTIEHRGAIAEELGEKFDRWIYGCDICQDVCPWNQKFSAPTAIHEFAPRTHNIAPVLHEVIGMTQEEFTKQFHHSPIKRTKLAGLVRNARTVATQQTNE